MFSPIISTLLAMKLPTGVAQAPSHPMVPKPKKERFVRSPAANNPKTVALAPIVDLTNKTKFSIFATPIVEEVPFISTALPQLHESSPHIASTSITLSETLLAGRRRTIAETKVQSSVRLEGTTPANEMQPTSFASPMLGLDPSQGESLDTILQEARIEPYLPPFHINLIVVPNPSIIPPTPQFTLQSQQAHSPTSHSDKSITSSLPIQK